jgi:hypothetical protein
MMREKVPWKTCTQPKLVKIGYGPYEKAEHAPSRVKHTHESTRGPVRRAGLDQAVTWINPGQVLRTHRTVRVRPNGARNQSPDSKRFPIAISPTTKHMDFLLSVAHAFFLV